MEQIILSAIKWHMQDKRMRPSQQGAEKGRSCLINIISFWDRVALLVGEGKAVDVVCQEFSEAFDTLSHNMLLEKNDGT